MLGVVEDPRGGAAFHHHPMMEYHRFIGELAYDGQVVAAIAPSGREPDNREPKAAVRCTRAASRLSHLRRRAVRVMARRAPRAVAAGDVSGGHVWPSPGVWPLAW